jgi:RNA polymerase sigma factor (sigma-70 family)
MESRVRNALKRVKFQGAEVANDVWEPTDPGPGQAFLIDLVGCIPRLRRLALRMTGRPGPDCDDLVQETLLRALEKSYQYQQRAGIDLCAWTSRILTHAFLDRCRRRRIEVQVPELLADPASETAEIATWRHVEDADLHEAIGALPASLRETYQLFEAGQGYAAIGSQLAIPVRTVGVRIHRARSRLRAALQTKIARAAA